MAHLYPNEQRGWMITFRVFFQDGSSVDKRRYSKVKQRAQLLFKDASTLEELSRRNAITRDEITYFVNQNLLTPNEAGKVSASTLFLNKRWDELEKEYEEYSREVSSAYTHSCNMSKMNIIRAVIGHKDPNKLTEEDLKEFIKIRRKGGFEYVSKNKKKKLTSAKSATIEKDLNILKIFLDPLGPDNPARKVRHINKKDERLPRPLWSDEILPFMKALKKRKPFLGGYFFGALPLRTSTQASGSLRLLI